MTTEAFGFPLDTDKLDDLSNNEKLRFIENVISNNEHELNSMFDWYADEIEIHVDYVDGSLTVSADDLKIENGEYSGTVNLMFNLQHFASCDDMCFDNECEYMTDFEIVDNYLYLTFTPPENKGLLNSTHSL